MSEKATAPWHAAYPQPRNAEPESLPCEDLLKKLKAGQKPGVDFLLVDLRRTDHEGGTIRGSLNLPAQSLYQSLPAIYNLCNATNIALVIWYCGSSRGRGTRAAGWFDDLIKDQGNNRLKSVTLLDGVKGWVAAGKEYQDCMADFDLAMWEK